MELQGIGEVIATRTLYLLEDDQPRGEVIVNIGKPHPFPESRDYYCAYQITGLGSERIFYAAGVDAFQAIELAMKAIGAELHLLNERHGGRLRWEAGERGDLGFPIP